MESDGAVFAGLSAVVGMSRFFGSLSIRSRSITFESRGKLNEFMTAETRQTVVHSERRVVVVRARLLPPNLNSSVILRGESASGGAITAGVQMPGGVRRKVAPRCERRASRWPNARPGPNLAEEDRNGNSVDVEAGNLRSLATAR